MKEVTSEKFYEIIGSLNVELSVLEPYPYKTEFKLKRDHRTVGFQDYDGKYYLND